MRRVIEQLDPEDLRTYGYPLDTLWAPLDEAQRNEGITPVKPKLNRYRLQRKAIIRLRALAQRNMAFRKVLEKIRLACDVLLRE